MILQDEIADFIWARDNRKDYPFCEAKEEDRVFYLKAAQAAIEVVERRLLSDAAFQAFVTETAIQTFINTKLHSEDFNRAVFLPSIKAAWQQVKEG